MKPTFSLLKPNVIAEQKGEAYNDWVRNRHLTNMRLQYLENVRVNKALKNKN